MVEKRKNYADIYKGIAIFLVILGHSSLCNNLLKQAIYAFHMPAFFLVYGLVYSADRHRDKGFISWRFIIDKVKRLLLPCYIWGLIYILLGRNVTVKGIAFLLYGNQIGFNNAGSLTSLWFLPCMFLAVIGFECLMKLIDQKKYEILMMCWVAFLLIVISYSMPRLKYGYLWCIDVAFMALAFILIGYLLKIATDRYRLLDNPRYLIVGGVISAVILLMTFKINLDFITINNVDLASRNYGNLMLYLLDALAGSYLLLVISVGLSNFRHTKLLCFMGRNTMPIFILHKPIVVFLSNVLEGTFLYNSVGGIVASIIATGICLGLAIVANKFIPFAFGVY